MVLCCYKLASCYPAQKKLKLFLLCHQWLHLVRTPGLFQLQLYLVLILSCPLPPIIPTPAFTFASQVIHTIYLLLCQRTIILPRTDSLPGHRIFSRLYSYGKFLSCPLEVLSLQESRGSGEYSSNSPPLGSPSWLLQHTSAHLSTFLRAYKPPFHQHSIARSQHHKQNLLQKVHLNTEPHLEYIVL